MTAFKQVEVPSGTFPAIFKINIGSLLKGKHIMNANLPLGSVVQYTQDSFMTWFLTRKHGWTNYDGDGYGNLSPEGVFRVIHIPGGEA